jgi:hypothetical protein
VCGIKSSGRWLAWVVLFFFCSACLPADVILTDAEADQLRANFVRLNQIVSEQKILLAKQEESITNSQAALAKLESSLKTVSESWTKLSNERDAWRTAALLTIAISGGVFLGAMALRK